MPDRFFSELPIQPEQTSVTLRGDESQHLAVVLRAKPGTEILVFDGQGSEWQGRVTSVSKSAVEVELGAQQQAKPAKTPLTLAVALPKGDRQKWLVEKCVELGVSRLIPLLTARSVAQPVESALGRLRRAVIEASKQSGQLRLMEIAAPRAWSDFVQEAAATNALRCVAQSLRAPETLEVLGHATLPVSSAQDQTTLWRSPREWLDTSAERMAAIGPEGGFTAAELRAALAAGWQLLDLGSGILRVETAALTIAAWQRLE